MTLLDIAAADLRSIMGDTVGGFSIPIRLISPSNLEVTINGLANDIGLTVDPDTGQAVAGSSSSVALPIADIDAAAIGRPRGVAAKGEQPWRVKITLPTGGEQTFKITRTFPDALGCLVCILETYDG
ncbi:MAG TPA: hypothetical protein VJN18_32875 [Polyangiaceae bacterium]|nr:hypothetical protein [Polyangiaceae bacterium]